MIFIVITRFGETNRRNTVYLHWDEWNDYSFRTYFGISYTDQQGFSHEIGNVRIAYKDQPISTPPLNIGDTFETLNANFFSLGSFEDYYVNLNKLGSQIRDEILIGLRDIAKFEDIFDFAIGEAVTQTSLLRYVTATTVTGQYRRLANGGPRLTSYKFQYVSSAADSNPFTLDFEVIPESSPPSNIHILIGRNGVGKTRLVSNMITSLLPNDENAVPVGRFNYDIDPGQHTLFANLISVTFSVFDDTKIIPEQTDKLKGILYYYVGIKTFSDSENTIPAPKNGKMLRDEFFVSLNACKIHTKKVLWLKAITTLESDANFRDSGVKELIDIPDSPDYATKVSDTFSKLSSGHKIILLTITRLVETVQERTLVLIDEPEAHLHPPLLSAFIRALSNLLIDTNGVAIIATHSPVILQEVPRTCVWKLRRAGIDTQAERPSTETFGENVGILTSDVFGLEVMDSGFYNLLKTKAAENRPYDQVLIDFKGQLGTEARIVLMTLLNEKNQQNAPDQ